MLDIQHDVQRSPASKKACDDIRQKVSKITAQQYNASRAVTAAHAKVASARQSLKRAMQARIDDAPKMVAFMTITEAEAEDTPYSLPDEITWKVSLRTRWFVCPSILRRAARCLDGRYILHLELVHPILSIYLQC